MSRIYFLIAVSIATILFGCKSIVFDYRELTNKVRVSTDSAGIVAELSLKSTGKLKYDRYYSWYNKGIIGVTQGAYSGKVLDGNYTTWYLENKQLREKGKYHMGLKVGKWLFWDKDGNIKEIQRWNNGKLVPVKPKRSMKSRIINMIPFKKKKP
jgi:antitoxin component YwqK of YwqJK toxin-antitoxin module